MKDQRLTLRGIKIPLQPTRDAQALIRERWDHWRKIVALHFPNAGRLASLEINRKFDDGKRHFAATEVDEETTARWRIGTAPRPSWKLIIVTISPRAGTLPLENLDGLVLHELGHVIDWAEDRWALPGQARGERDEEVRADKIVEFGLGIPIRYDKKLVETTGVGTKRPRGLR